MEERAVGGKEKKYVLYTVVNDDKARAGFGVWMVRILLGSLLLVALAVVPYVSLRLAQVNDRTLVVFQPVPVHNHSRNHHHKLSSRHPITASGSGSHPPQSASLIRANYTTEMPKSKKGSNATIVTLHESAVTLSLLEDTNTTFPKNQTEGFLGEAEEMTILEEKVMNGTTVSASPETKTETEEKATFLEEDLIKEGKKDISSEQSTHVESPPRDVQIEINPTTSTSEDSNDDSTQVTPETLEKGSGSKLLKILKSPTTIATKAFTVTTTSKPITKLLTSPKVGITHKLAYVATATSGNHVGGICVWKTNKNVTKWSYFYENIPIEYQSPKDNTDHEMRAIIAAVRLWAGQWHDYHVVLRSQHQAIESSKHPTRVQFVKELDELSDQHFTYELEWRQRKDDSLMGIAYCLARLHKDFAFWFNKFENHVDQRLGKQDWKVAKEKNRLFVPQKLFLTETNPEMKGKLGDLTSLSLY